MNFRKKGLGMLRANVIRLPLEIAVWRRQGRHEQAAIGEEIFKASVAEIARRERIKVGLPA